MTNGEVCARFKNGEPDGKAKNLYIVGDIIYSFGEHFPLAYRRFSDSFIVNVGNYSNTTARQRHVLLRYLRDTDTAIEEVYTPEELRARIKECEKRN